ncbi:MAG: CRISPR-associated protein Cas4 [Mariprofundaceae bacterium]|nr:CRISPR-associated protein Cas4 [Mariprofundaceae bacterium]
MSEAISISALQHYIYCPRQCALIHVAQAWSENLHTQKGQREHERVDVAEYEMKDGVRIERALPVWSDSLAITGKCDVVEFHPKNMVFPVEYKHGPRKAGLHDDVQLCAQALCLEEMLDCSISIGAIYHVKSRRRREVQLDHGLRQTTLETVAAVHNMVKKQRVILSPYGKHCKQCSLLEMCMPDVKVSQQTIFQPIAEDSCGKF